MHPAITVGRECETRSNVDVGEIWEIIEYYHYRHAAAEIIEQVSHRGTRAPDAGLSAADTRVQR